MQKAQLYLARERARPIRAPPALIPAPLAFIVSVLGHLPSLIPATPPPLAPRLCFDYVNQVYRMFQMIPPCNHVGPQTNHAVNVVSSLIQCQRYGTDTRSFERQVIIRLYSACYIQLRAS